MRTEKTVPEQGSLKESCVESLVCVCKVLDSVIVRFLVDLSAEVTQRTWFDMLDEPEGGILALLQSPTEGMWRGIEATKVVVKRRCPDVDRVAR